jgi:hypothetical protein
MGKTKKELKRENGTLLSVFFPLFVEDSGWRRGLRPKPQRHNGWKCQKNGGPRFPSPKVFMSVFFLLNSWS